MSRNHHFSQNFLRSPKTALMLVGHTNIRKNDITLDIGAGSGVFTYALSKKSMKVYSIELDKIAFSKLKNNTANLKNVDIINADFLKFDLNKIPHDYKICSNIPFHLSSKILQKIARAKNKPKSAYFILQKQFAKKLNAHDRNFSNALAAKLFPFFEVKIKKPLRKTDFTPPPAVDTVFFEMKRREIPLIDMDDYADYAEMLDKSFHDIKFFNSLYKRFELRKLRPSELTGDEWLEIFKDF